MVSDLLLVFSNISLVSFTVRVMMVSLRRSSCWGRGCPIFFTILFLRQMLVLFINLFVLAWVLYCLVLCCMLICFVHELNPIKGLFTISLCIVELLCTEICYVTKCLFCVIFLLCLALKEDSCLSLSLLVCEMGKKILC